MTRAPRGLLYCTYGLRVPASCVLYVPEAQGSLARGMHHCTYAVRVPASGVPYVPRTVWCTAGLQSQLLELANGSCAAFVESADCVKRVHEKMTRIANHLARLEAALPAVGAEASCILASH